MPAPTGWGLTHLGRIERHCHALGLRPRLKLVEEVIHGAFCARVWQVRARQEARPIALRRERGCGCAALGGAARVVAACLLPACTTASWEDGTLGH
jgi:hypothetical protein